MNDDLYDLTEQEFAERIKKFCEENPKLVRVKPVLDGSALILKYNKNVFFDGLWTPEILECRGTIVDAKTFAPIQRPFTKIFSQEEKMAPKFESGEQVFSVRKVNGYMLAATIHNGELLLSTTGTTDSDFVKFAKTRYLPEFRLAVDNGLIDENHTTIFEVVDSIFDPHVIPDPDGLWVLAHRPKKWNSEHFFYYEKGPDTIHFPETSISTFEEMNELVKRVDHEGFVIQSMARPRCSIKLKSPFYTAVKYLGRKNPNALDLAVRLFRESGHSSTPRWYDRKTNQLIKIGLSEMSKEYESVKNMTEQQRFAFLREILSGEL